METQLQRLVDIVREGENEMGGEGGIDIHTLSCVKQIAGEKSLYNAGSPARCSVMIQRTRMDGE